MYAVVRNSLISEVFPTIEEAARKALYRDGTVIEVPNIHKKKRWRGNNNTARNKAVRAELNRQRASCTRGDRNSIQVQIDMLSYGKLP